MRFLRLRRERLVAGVIAVSLLTIEAEGLDHRKIVEGEQAGILAVRCVAVLVPGPGRDTEDVALLPVETLAHDDGIAAAFGDLIEHTARVSMGPGLLAGPQQLHAGTDRLH